MNLWPSFSSVFVSRPGNWVLMALWTSVLFSFVSSFTYESGKNMVEKNLIGPWCSFGSSTLKEDAVLLWAHLDGDVSFFVLEELQLTELLSLLLRQHVALIRLLLGFRSFLKTTSAQQKKNALDKSWSCIDLNKNTFFSTLSVWLVALMSYFWLFAKPRLQEISSKLKKKNHLERRIRNPKLWQHFFTDSPIFFELFMSHLQAESVALLTFLAFI